MAHLAALKMNVEHSGPAVSHLLVKLTTVGPYKRRSAGGKITEVGRHERGMGGPRKGPRKLFFRRNGEAGRWTPQQAFEELQRRIEEMGSNSDAAARLRMRLQNASIDIPEGMQGRKLEPEVKPRRKRKRRRSVL